MTDWTAAPEGPVFATTRATMPPAALPGAARYGAVDHAAPRFGATSASAALAGFNAEADRAGGRARLGLLVAGGAVSLALVAGVGAWGYKLVLREVLGLPVVAAEAGPMRVAPAEPGGLIVAHQGLSVNAVAGEGEAAAPSDTLTLAPPTPGLAAEDMTVAQTMAEAGEPVPADPAAPVVEEVAAAPDAAGRPMTADEVQAFADRIAGTAPTSADPVTAAVQPLVPAAATAVAPAPTEAALAADVAPAAPVAAPIPADVPGVAVAWRPPARPRAALASVQAVEPTAAVAPQAAPAATAVALTDAIAPGTNLVQLGAFDSAEVAASEWDRLSGRFAEFLAGKDRVIQEAESGGRTFFRLRAMGFADLADARRFCAALVAEDAGCIPVVVR